MSGVKGRSGGARVGAGMKRRDPKAAWLAGEKPGPKRVPKVTAVTDDTVVKAPSYLTAEELAVWKDLAPHARAEKTLTDRTVMAFATLCRNIVILRKLEAAPLTCAGPDHRGMLARVEMGWARFRLVPDGKPVIDDAAPIDEWAEFDQPLQVIKGGKS
jgi:hypothetical protein